MAGGLAGGFGSDQAGPGRVHVLTQSVNPSQVKSGGFGLVWFGFVWIGVWLFSLGF